MKFQREDVMTSVGKLNSLEFYSNELPWTL